jgi:hypothetical protein
MVERISGVQSSFAMAGPLVASQDDEGIVLNAPPRSRSMYCAPKELQARHGIANALASRSAVKSSETGRTRDGKNTR